MKKNSLLILLLILSFTAWADEFKSLSCSKNGTLIFYLNGMNYTHNQYEDALSFLRDISEEHRINFDQESGDEGIKR